MSENIREIALDVLLVLEKEQEYSNRLIKAVLDKYDYLDGRDKAFIKRVTEGTLERRTELDYDLDQVSTVPAGKMKPLIRCLMRMSLYQILYMDAVPDRAVCNEACKLAAKRGFGSLKGFVNGVLRRLSREKDSLPLPDREKEPLEYLSVKYSMPEWIAKRWLSEYGREIAETLLEGMLGMHGVQLRLRTDMSEAHRQQLFRKLEEAGAAPVRSGYLPYSLRVAPQTSVDRLPGFSEGLYTVQDVTSALAVEAAGIKPTDFVIDVCAAPGGKSLLAAEKAKRVLSRDISPEKTELIRQNAARMKADNIQVQVFDAAQEDESLLDSADAVLLDVPCSGLGVIGKKPDIKYRVTKNDLDSLVQLQRKIVTVCSRYVKPGGTLIYSTCTINPDENEEMIRFISEELPFDPLPLEDVLPEKVLEDREHLEQLRRKSGHESKTELSRIQQRACIQFLPGCMEGDGFFIGRFRRRS